MKFSLVYLFAILSFICNSLYVTNIPSTLSPPTRRKHSSITYDPISNSVFLYGGYQSSDRFLDDMWRFDLSSNTWEEIHSPSILSPGRRIKSEMKVLNNERSILLYGGTTEKGPAADLWLFDIQNYMVVFM